MAEPDLSPDAIDVLLRRQFMRGLPPPLRLKLLESDPTPDLATISSNVLNCLNSILPGSHDKQKLVAQCYDGASVMSGQHRGVQSIVKDAYPNAHYVIVMLTSLILFCNMLFHKSLVLECSLQI